MITKNIKYKDYNGVEREEKFFFNLTKAELMEMEMGTEGGMAEYIQGIIDAKDTPSLVKIFKDLILKAYGEKSADGKRFIKMDNGRRLANEFAETEAYSELFIELSQDAVKAAEFIKGIVPSDIKIDDEEIKKLTGGEPTE